MFRKKIKLSSFVTMGDVNGLLGIVMDNMAAVSFMSGILVFIFKFPIDVVFQSIVPATAFTAFISNTIFCVNNIWVSKKTGRRDLTAIPSGIDTPSVIGVSLGILGPAFLYFKGVGQDPHTAALSAWYVGMASVLMMGVLKILIVTVANKIQKAIPAAGLLGTLAGVAVGLLGLAPLVEVFSIPIVGIVSLGIIIYTMVAEISLPKNIPGVFLAVVAGAVIYHVLGPLNLLGLGSYTKPVMDFYFGCPAPSLHFLSGVKPIIDLGYLSLIIPLGILVVMTDINVAAGAVVSGDPYQPKSVLFLDGVATILSAICGSVGQSTVYIGYPAYKKMEAKTAYVIFAAIFILFGGMFGYISFFVNLIPTAVFASILIFIAVEVNSFAFFSVNPKHYAAVTLAIFPAILRYMAIQLSDQDVLSIAKYNELVTVVGIKFHSVLVVNALSSGFIFVGMLWGGVLAEIIDKRLKIASVYFFILSAFSLFGLLHSVKMDGGIYLPWNLPSVQQSLAYNFSAGYFILGAMLLILSIPKFKAKNTEEFYPLKKDLSPNN
ncbi:MAG: hypothetical protein WCR55_02015 [Lentisphaerota bacterium]